MGVILGFLGEKDIAFPLLDRAVAVARTLDDVEMLALALSLNASIRHMYQDLDAALPMTREAMAIPITSERHLIRAWVCSMGSWVLWDTGSKQEARNAIVESHELCLEHDDHLVRRSTLDAVDLMAPDYMTSEQTAAERLDERDWLHEAGVAEDAATISGDGWSFLRGGRWIEALEYVEHLLTLPQRNWREEFDRRLKKSALLQLLDRTEEAATLGEQLVAEARNAIDRHHALCHLAIARRDVGDHVGSEAARAEAMQYLLDGHNPAGGWRVYPHELYRGMDAAPSSDPAHRGRRKTRRRSHASSAPPTACSIKRTSTSSSSSPASVTDTRIDYQSPTPRRAPSPRPHRWPKYWRSSTAEPRPRGSGEFWRDIEHESEQPTAYGVVRVQTCQTTCQTNDRAQDITTANERAAKPLVTCTKAYWTA